MSAVRESRRGKPAVLVDDALIESMCKDDAMSLVKSLTHWLAPAADVETQVRQNIFRTIEPYLVYHNALGWDREGSC